MAATRMVALLLVVPTVLLLVLNVPRAIAQEQTPEEQALERQLGPEVAAEVRNIALLPPEFREEPLRELAAKHPNTNIARWVEQLLAAYEKKARLQAETRAAAEAKTARIRSYWDRRRRPPLRTLTNQLTLTNNSEELFVYEVMYHDTEWLGPYVLLPGVTRELGRTVVIRQLAPGDTQSYTLSRYSHYEFREPAAGGPPALFTVSPQ